MITITNQLCHLSLIGTEETKSMQGWMHIVNRLLEKMTEQPYSPKTIGLEEILHMIQLRGLHMLALRNQRENLLR